MSTTKKERFLKNRRQNRKRKKRSPLANPPKTKRRKHNPPSSKKSTKKRCSIKSKIEFLAKLDELKIDIFDPLQQKQFDDKINDHFQAYYPQFTVHKNGQKSLNARKMCKLREMIRDWKRDENVLRLNYVSTSQSTSKKQACRICGGGPKAMIDDDTLLMIYKKFNLLQQTQNITHSDLVLIFDAVFEGDDKYRIQWKATDRFSKKVKVFNLSQIDYQTKRFKQKYNVIKSGSGHSTKCELGQLIPEWMDSCCTSFLYRPLVPAITKISHHDQTGLLYERLSLQRVYNTTLYASFRGSDKIQNGRNLYLLVPTSCYDLVIFDITLQFFFLYSFTNSCCC